VAQPVSGVYKQRRQARDVDDVVLNRLAIVVASRHKKTVN